MSKPQDWKPQDWHRPLIEGWVQVLSESPWSHFVTLTFTKEASVELAQREGRRWLRRLEQRAQTPIQSVMLVDWGGGGRVHLHGLLYGAEDLTDRVLRATWNRGWSECPRYDPDRGAVRYLAKKIVCDDDDCYHLSPGLGSPPGSRRARRRGRAALNRERTRAAPRHTRQITQ